MYKNTRGKFYKNKRKHKNSPKYLKENSAEIQQKNTELAEKNAEIEKYKKLLVDNLAKELNNSIKAKEKADTDLEDLNEGWKLELKKKEEELEMYKDMKEIVDYKVTDLLKLKQYDDLKKKVDKQDKIINKSIRYMEDTFVLEEDKCITELYNILKGSIR